MGMNTGFYKFIVPALGAKLLLRQTRGSDLNFPPRSGFRVCLLQFFAGEPMKSERVVARLAGSEKLVLSKSLGFLTPPLLHANEETA
jgi:hypothetical protein